MKIMEFKEKLFLKARALGFDEFEIFYVDGESFEVAIYEKEIDKYNVNTTLGLSFRGIYQGHMGYAYTEILDEEAMELLVQAARDNAMTVENEDAETIYGGQDEYAKIIGYNPELSQVTAEQKIKLALQMEEETFLQSDKVKQIQYCIVESGSGSNRIINSKGLDLYFRSNAIYAILIPVIQDGDKMNTAFAYKATNQFEEIDPNALAKEAVTKALSYSGAEPVDSGKYRIAIRNDVAGELLSTFSGIFSAYNVQKGMSLLKGKVGTQIGSEKLTIIDDPLYPGGLSSIPFDAEGVATYTKQVVQQGKLETLLYNLKTALKDGVKSTGNAAKSSYASPVDTAPSNFYIQSGDKSFDKLLQTLGDGLLITELQGMHSGANAVSGDFSLAAKGFVVQAGQIKNPVEQITVAGNFYALLEDIEELASDLIFGLPSGKGTYGSPTLLIRELSIAGK